MTLSDVELLESMSEGRLKINPSIIIDKALQPASIDVRLGGSIKRQIHRHDGSECRPGNPPDFQSLTLGSQGVLLYPGNFYLGSTIEHFSVPSDLAIKLEGKSSWGRCGLEVHSTAGWIDPGFEGEITFEMKVVGVEPIRVIEGDYIAQICAYRLARPAARPYGHPELASRYQGQRGPTIAR